MLIIFFLMRFHILLLASTLVSRYNYCTIDRVETFLGILIILSASILMSYSLVCLDFLNIGYSNANEAAPLAIASYFVARSLTKGTDELPKAFFIWWAILIITFFFALNKSISACCVRENNANILILL